MNYEAPHVTRVTSRNAKGLLGQNRDRGRWPGPSRLYPRGLFAWKFYWHISMLRSQLSCHFTRAPTQLESGPASGQRESDQPTGTHGGLPKGDAANMQTVPRAA